MTVSVEIINQLNDNYSYLISSNENNSGIIIDPAETNKILDVLKKKKLNLNYIFITHHHSDHTSGVAGLVKAYPEVKIFSPSELNSISVNLISDGNTITTNINEFEVIHTPGHTLDHIILCDQKNNLIHINPGAAGNHGFHPIKTIVRFDLDKGKIGQLEVIELGKRGI